jgi:hypothetical protein
MSRGGRSYRGASRGAPPADSQAQMFDLRAEVDRLRGASALGRVEMLVHLEGDRRQPDDRSCRRTGPMGFMAVLQQRDRAWRPGSTAAGGVGSGGYGGSSSSACSRSPIVSVAEKAARAGAATKLVVTATSASRHLLASLVPAMGADPAAIAQRPGCWNCLERNGTTGRAPSWT